MTMPKIRVVLIEDHDLTRIGLEKALQHYPDVEVVGEAVNGIEGLKMLSYAKPDVAIVDIGLPGITGIELIRRFKQSLSTSKVSSNNPTKFIMLTLQDNQDSVLAAFAAGADSYCMKDISQDKLYEVLKITNQGSNWIDPSIAQIILRQVQQAQQKALLEFALPEDERILIQRLGDDHEKLIADNPLTEREIEVLQLIVRGYSNAKMAEQLYVTLGTIKTHVRNILNKLSVDDRTQAAVLALRSGLVA
jgi:DNA-binding NarL/FixJ family response regulator